MRPGRVVFTKLPRGATVGTPSDEAQQLDLLRATIGLLAEDLPLKPVVRPDTLTREL